MKIINYSKLSLLILIFLLLLANFTFVSEFALADADPNLVFAFKSVYIEPIQDNVDGAFREPVEQSYKTIFEKNQRFELVKDKNQADTIVRSSLIKKSEGLDLEITVLLNPSGDVFAVEKTTIPSTASGRDTGLTISQLLKTALKRIPFYGTITGRDGKELTFDIGALHGLQTNDTVQVSRIGSIKKHPLLKTIVDVQLIPVGSVIIDQVEESIAFGHIQSEIMGEQVRKFHKVTAIEARPTLSKNLDKKYRLNDDGSKYEESMNDHSEDKDRPTFGFVGLGANAGQFSTSSATGAGTTKTTGSALNLGFQLNGELWITKSWFVDLGLGYSTMSYSNDPVTTTNPNAVADPSVNASTRTIGFNAGYRFLPTGSIYGPSAFAKIGYYNFKWDVPVDSAKLLSPKTYAGFNIGIGGSLPIIDMNSGLMLKMNLLLFPGISEDGFKTGSKASTTVVNFYLGGYHFFTSKIALRAGFQFDIYSADFDEGVSQSSTSQKTIGFIPALLYYF